MVYLLQFSHPIGSKRHTAQYYLGYCSDAPGGLESRLAAHREGRGARITAAAIEKGATLEIVHVWPGEDRSFERRMKNRKSHARVLACAIRNQIGVSM